MLVQTMVICVEIKMIAMNSWLKLKLYCLISILKIKNWYAQIYPFIEWGPIRCHFIIIKKLNISNKREKWVKTKKILVFRYKITSNLFDFYDLFKLHNF